jgi:hypothetical protein
VARIYYPFNYIEHRQFQTKIQKKATYQKNSPIWFTERLRVFKLLYNARGGIIRNPTPEKYATVDKGSTDRTI